MCGHVYKFTNCNVKSFFQALSAMTKSLQHECIQKNIDGAMLTTNNDIVQQFVGVLEAGFLHGLKVCLAKEKI